MSTTMRGAGAGWPTPDDLVDARLELDVERVERARLWQQAKDRVTEEHHALRSRPTWFRLRAEPLLAALDELQRLEEAGGGL